jgi:hypothetical protein
VTSSSFTGQEQFWLVKMGRTANISFPYLGGIAGASYVNGLATSLSLSPAVKEAPVGVQTVTAQLGVEVTDMQSLQQAP